MKKIALVLAALLLVSGAAFAEITAGGDVTITGSVSTTLGMDIQNEVWGADADTSFNIKIPFANGTATTGGDDEVYGEISFKDVGVNWQEDDYDVDFDDAEKDNPGFTDNDYDGTDFYDSVSAKVVVGDIFVALNAEGYNFNYADGGDDYDVNLDDDWYDPTDDRGDITFGYDNGTVKASILFGAKSGITRYSDEDDEIDFASPFTGDQDEVDDIDSTEGSNKKTDTDEQNGIIFALMGGYTSDLFSIPVTVTLDPFFNFGNYASKSAGDDLLLAVGIDPSVCVGIVKIGVPVDFVFTNMKEEEKVSGSLLGLDVAPNFNFTVMEGFDINVNGYFYMKSSTSVYDGEEVGSTSRSLLDLGLDFTLDNLLPGFVANLEFDFEDLYYSQTQKIGSTETKTDAPPIGWGLDTSFAYTIIDGFTVTIEPDVDGDFNGYNKEKKEVPFLFESFDFGASIEFGPELTGIDNTTIKLAYSNLDVVNSDLRESDKDRDGKKIEGGFDRYTDENDKGIVSVSATISF